MTQIMGKNAKPVGITPAIILISPKFGHNIGAAVRVAANLGIAQVWYTGDRYQLEPGERLPREERMRGYDGVTLIQNDYPLDCFPPDTTPVAVELLPGATALPYFMHPENPVYIFGPEDGAIPPAVRALCHRFVFIPGLHCYNLANAAALTLYHRYEQRLLAGMETMLTIRGEERGFLPGLER